MRISRYRPSPAFVLAAIALFVALSGTAIASHEAIFSDDIVDGEVKTADIANNDVRAADIRTGNVTSSDVADDTTSSALTGTDIAADSLGAADLGNSSVGSAEVVNGSLAAVDIGASAVGTSQVADGSLTRADINVTSIIQMNGTGDQSCTPTSSTFVTCGSVSLNLPVQSSVLVMASGMFSSASGVGADAGACKLTRGLSDVSALTGFSSAVFLENAGANDGNFGFARNGLDVDVPAGSQVWNLRCNRTDGSPQFSRVQVTALRLVD
jgi:hypothetical protein